MNVRAHAILYVAFSFLLCGFDAATLYWYKRTQSAKDLDLTCSATFPFSDATCKKDPCPWIGLLILLADSMLPDPHFIMMIPAAYNNEVPFQLLYTPADRVPFTHNLRYYNVLQGWDGCGSFLSEGLRCITLNTMGLVGSVFSRQRNREFKLKYLKRLLDNNSIICLQDVHGKDEVFLQAIQVLAPKFRLFGTFLPDNEECGRIGHLHSQGPFA